MKVKDISPQPYEHFRALSLLPLFSTASSGSDSVLASALHPLHIRFLHF